MSLIKSNLYSLLNIKVAVAMGGTSSHNKLTVMTCK
jgi:hypothetical protein